jgi:selenide,water dikinase
VLRPLQNLFPAEAYPDILVGLGSPDDAAVWRLDAERALVVTTDFFTPVVDDAYDYGAIAAANALSDIYAMGAKPFLALNVAALPPDLPDIDARILLGGAEKVKEAGVALVGGHTIQSQEPIYGLIVIGMAHPERMLSKGGARPGDVLLLSKPLGSGVVTTALKRQQADPADVAAAVAWMKRLNRDASELAMAAGLRGGTDVTGFGLLGHAWEMADASGVQFRFHLDAMPFVAGARRYADEWIFPGGSSDNLLFFKEHVTFATGISEAEQMLLFDAQTSGGLLLTAPAAALPELLAAAAQRDQPLWQIGVVQAGSGIVVQRAA